MKITPKNWARHQHYKNRKPPWIKLHRELLDDCEFGCLPVASMALAPRLWLLASEYDKGEITASCKQIAFRLRMSVEDFKRAITPLIDSCFFICDDEALATCYHRASKVLATEGEREKEEEEKKPFAQSDKPSAPAILEIILNNKSMHPITQEDIDDWCKLFPAVDVLQELRKMAAWADANPLKRKTDRGIRRFIVTWLSKEQDKGRVYPVAVPPKPEEDRSDFIRRRQATLERCGDGC